MDKSSFASPLFFDRGQIKIRGEYISGYNYESKASHLGSRGLVEIRESIWFFLFLYWIFLYINLVIDVSFL